MERLETERLILRRWTLDDAEDCFKYAKDERVGPAAGWKPHESVEESREIIKSVFFEPEVYAICLKDDPELRIIGTINLIFGKNSPIPDLTDEDGEMGYWIGVEHWGKGYATEAANCIAKHGFQNLKMKRLWGRHYVSNTRSGNVLRKLGLEHKYDREEKDRLTGEMIMVSVLCLEKEAWEAKKIIKLQK